MKIVPISRKLLHSHRCLAYSLVRNSHDFHVNFIHSGNKGSKHTTKHTLQSHGHMIHHAPAFEHLGGRHAAAVLRRCYNTVGRTGEATPDMAKWISESASTLSPLQISIWCTFPTKKEGTVLGNLHDGEI